MASIPSNPTAQTPHKHSSSTGIADPKVISPPEYANRMVITAKTGAARLTFDGSVPTAANGIVLPAGVHPLDLPFAKAVGFAGDGVAGELDILYVD